MIGKIFLRLYHLWKPNKSAAQEESGRIEVGGSAEESYVVLCQDSLPSAFRGKIGATIGTKES